jgi:hypothetical protein
MLADSRMFAGLLSAFRPALRGHHHRPNADPAATTGGAVQYGTLTFALEPASHAFGHGQCGELDSDQPRSTSEAFEKHLFLEQREPRFSRIQIEILSEASLLGVLEQHHRRLPGKD